MNIDEYVAKINAFKLPRYSQLPDLDLYMDQLLYYIETQLDIFRLDENDKVLTTAMVNNYVKQKLIYPTSKKRYTKDHIACLIFICVFKQIYSIDEISRLITLQTQKMSLDVTYDFFCTELENALVEAFSSTPVSIDKDFVKEPEKVLMGASITAVANKLLVQKLLQNNATAKKE